MRLPSFPTIIRAFYTLSNTTTARFSTASFASLKALPQTRGGAGGTVLRSMPTIPFLGSLFSSGAVKDMTDYPVKKSDSEWRAVLNKEQFRILREKGTEPPYAGAYDKHSPTTGTYTCAACSAPLYRATHKFKSGCGWPAYFDSIPGAVVRHTDSTFGMARTEIVCAKCGGHLGHVFKGEGYPTPTDERHCVNSISLTFRDEEVGGEVAAESKV
ncbi:MAG: hypothetical protein Q9194_001359 [Teloschistes cf. exilis]